MSDNIPDPWRSAAERKGITPTYRPLGDRAGMAHETVRRVISGQSVNKKSVRKLADALGVDVETIHEWRRESPPDYGSMFEPDESSMLLTTEERAVINTLIRMLTDGRGEQREDDGDGNASPNPRAGVSPAPGDPAEGVSFESPDESPEGGASGRGRRARGRGGPA